MVSPVKPSVNTKKLVLAAILTAAAIIMHTVETMLPPLMIGVPVRLGLANIFTLCALILLGAPYALAIAVLRCLVAVLITGAVSQLPYSLAGALLSFSAMLMLDGLRRKDRISAVGESVFGSFAFNVGQLAVGILIAGNAMLFYFPIMSLLSVPTGIFTGAAAHYICKGIAKLPYVKGI
ncbi:MAG: Gx transporter family protein [Clostridia bacterium]|nr:Gx transporter family protein [Clostridia bacterium]MBQ2110582.1 Gx transporter family protein [Clostridia bacterium]